MINSPYDEESLRFSASGDTLYFGSMGHTTTGGYDIFYSVRDQNGTWGKAVNFGYPVNTAWDDLFFFPPGVADSSFYFASNRPESMGGLDLFKGTFIPPEPVVIPVVIPEPVKPDTVIIRDTVVIKEVIQAPPPPVAEAPKEMLLFLTGKIKDSETGDPILARIDVIDFATDSTIATTASSDVDGSYRVRLPEKKSYMVDVRGTGFLSDMKRINIPPAYTGEVYTLDMSLIKVKVGKKVVLNNILFETGKAVLTTGSYTELDRLYNILVDNPQMKIEISGHTDNTGSLALNNSLSASRAKAVVDYMIHKGIDVARLEYKGYGPLQPIADNATPEGRKMNRRVEFKILEF
jgi:outer membrane protein OmpA-like peptidoglycan-associated protein